MTTPTSNSHITFDNHTCSYSEDSHTYNNPNRTTPISNLKCGPPQETVAAFPLPFKLRKLKLQIENTPNGNMSIGNIAKKLLCSHEVVFQANLKYISKLQWNQFFFFCIYTSHATACFRSGSPCCFAKDTRPRLLWLKIMASAVVVIYINLFDNSHYFFNSTCGANVTHFSFNNKQR